MRVDLVEVWVENPTSVKFILHRFIFLAVISLPLLEIVCLRGMGNEKDARYDHEQAKYQDFLILHASK